MIHGYTIFHLILKSYVEKQISNTIVFHIVDLFFRVNYSVIRDDKTKKTVKSITLKKRN